MWLVFGNRSRRKSGKMWFRAALLVINLCYCTVLDLNKLVEPRWCNTGTFLTFLYCKLSALQSYRLSDFDFRFWNSLQHPCRWWVFINPSEFVHRAGCRKTSASLTPCPSPSVLMWSPLLWSPSVPPRRPVTSLIHTKFKNFPYNKTFLQELLVFLSPFFLFFLLLF